MRTGVTAAQYKGGSIPQATASQLSQETSGNAALKPEQGDTYTVGVNFAPSQIAHLTGSIDYFHIQVKDEVGTIPYLVIVSNCANTGDPTYCSQIVRQPGTGSLNGNSVAGGGFVSQKLYNLGTAVNSGIDVQLNYRVDLRPGFGGVAFALNGAYRATWDAPWDVSASLTWRYIGPVSQDNNNGDPTLHFATFGAYDLYNSRIPSFSYLDLEATWNVNRILQIRAGANTVLDKNPPIINTDIAPGGAANTYSAYDMVGRRLFLAFTAKF